MEEPGDVDARFFFWNSSGVTNPARIQLFKIETVV